MKESLDNRTQITAKNEVETELNYLKEPIDVREIMVNEDWPWLTNQLYRSHNILFLYLASLQNDYEIENKDDVEYTAGYMKWFTSYPDDLVPCHQEVYGDILEKYLTQEEFRKS